MPNKISPTKHAIRNIVIMVLWYAKDVWAICSCIVAGADCETDYLPDEVCLMHVLSRKANRTTEQNKFSTIQTMLNGKWEQVVSRVATNSQHFDKQIHKFTMNQRVKIYILYRHYSRYNAQHDNMNLNSIIRFCIAILFWIHAGISMKI